MRAVLAAGVAAVTLATLHQIGGLAVAWVAGWELGAIAGCALLVAALPVRPRAADVLRFDGAQWWWRGPGAPLAVSPEVFIDTERWMLLRLRAAADPDREGRVLRWLAVSRGGLGAAWTPLRLRLFLAQG